MFKEWRANGEVQLIGHLEPDAEPKLQSCRTATGLWVRDGEENIPTEVMCTNYKVQVREVG